MSNFSQDSAEAKALELEGLAREDESGMEEAAHTGRYNGCLRLQLFWALNTEAGDLLYKLVYNLILSCCYGNHC